MILLNDFQRQWAACGADVLAAVARVGESGWYILGREVEQFESVLARELNSPFAIGCASGLDAIELGLRALGLKPGQRVVTTPLTAFATTLAIVRAGGVPVFVDVDPSGNIDLDQCEEVFRRQPDIRFWVPVHLYGAPLDLVRLEQIQQRFGVQLLEDCAQSIGAAWGGRLAGTVGALAALSFYPTKNLGAMGDAGALLARTPEHANALKSLRNYGQSTRYVHNELGLNSRLDELHAAILGQAFLPRLRAWTDRRREIARRYSAEITNPGLELLRPKAGAEPAWHLFPLFLKRAEEREPLMKHLLTAGVQSAIHYPRLVSDQEALRDVAFESAFEPLRARALAASEVSLPMNPYLTDDEVDRVIVAVNSFGVSQ